MAELRKRQWNAQCHLVVVELSIRWQHLIRTHSGPLAKQPEKITLYMWGDPISRFHIQV